MSPHKGEQYKKVVYFVRHAEATHNIRERQAVQAAIQRGLSLHADHEEARRAVLQDESLRDAPLSTEGSQQIRTAFDGLQLLHSLGQYPMPQIVLVSPLRRALMTATELFGACNPTFIALEILRERRTGYAADERSHVDVLERDFPHVDFSNLRHAPTIPIGEEKVSVRKRVCDFFHGPLAESQGPVAVVTHKGWLREMRFMLKSWVDAGDLQVDFDLDCWDQKLFGNAEVRVNEFGWTGKHLDLIVSRSVESALSIRSLSEDVMSSLPSSELATSGT